MMKDEIYPFAQFPWMHLPFGAFQNMTGAGTQPVNHVMGIQKIWAEAMTAAMRGFQEVTAKQSQAPQSGVHGGSIETRRAAGHADQPPAAVACQEAIRNTQTLAATVLNANLKALDTFYGRFAAVWGEIGKAPLGQSASAAALPLRSAAEAYEGAAIENWKTIEKAQETSAKAWMMLQKRLTEGVKEWNASEGASIPAGDMPAAFKESYDRLAADSAGLFDVIQKTNANALSLMQKRFSSAVDEMAGHVPAASEQGIEKLEAAAHAYERAASTIAGALTRANREVMEAVQSWSAETLNSRSPAHRLATKFEQKRA